MTKTLFTAGQRETNQSIRPANNSVKTQGTESVYEGRPVLVFEPEYSMTTGNIDEFRYEHLNQGFGSPAAFDTLDSSKLIHA